MHQPKRPRRSKSKPESTRTSAAIGASAGTTLISSVGLIIPVVAAGVTLLPGKAAAVALIAIAAVLASLLIFAVFWTRSRAEKTREHLLPNDAALMIASARRDVASLSGALRVLVSSKYDLDVKARQLEDSLKPAQEQLANIRRGRRGGSNDIREAELAVSRARGDLNTVFVMIRRGGAGCTELEHKLRKIEDQLDLATECVDRAIAVRPTK